MTAYAHAQPVTMGGLEVLGMITPEYQEILTPAALAFVEELERRFGPRRHQLLNIRVKRQHAFDAGELPDFWSQTREIRESEWKVAPIPKVLPDRRVGMTASVDRNTVNNGLNAPANV